MEARERWEPLIRKVRERGALRPDTGGMSVRECPGGAVERTQARKLLVQRHGAVAEMANVSTDGARRSSGSPLFRAKFRIRLRAEPNRCIY
jgi:hypothetical protein